MKPKVTTTDWPLRWLVLPSWRRLCRCLFLPVGEKKMNQTEINPMILHVGHAEAEKILDGKDLTVKSDDGSCVAVVHFEEDKARFTAFVIDKRPPVHLFYYGRVIVWCDQGQVGLEHIQLEANDARNHHLIVSIHINQPKEALANE